MEGSITRKDDEDHISLKMPQDCLDSIEAKVKGAYSSPLGRPYSIFRVHEKFHKVNDGAYSPEVVSIGPLHHGQPNLQAIEQTKLMYSQALLYRTAEAKLEEPYGDQVPEMSQESPPEGWLAILRKCTAFIESIEEEARNCYSEPLTHIKSDEFVEMMLTDGLFLIEHFHRRIDLVRRVRYDPLFDKIGNSASLGRDLLLLENQIPMLVLTGLFKIVTLGRQVTLSRGFSLNQIILYYFNDLIPRDKDLIMSKYSEDCCGQHILGLIADTFRPCLSREDEEEGDHINYPNNECAPLLGDLTIRIPSFPRVGQHKMFDSWKVIPTVTAMKQAGIKFKKGSTDGSFLDIKFNNGVLEIPPIIIGNKTELFFRNLIAYEQCLDGQDTFMSSYAFLMDSLVETAQDVRILCSEGIIKNYLGTHEDATYLFNKLCCEVSVHDSYYSHLAEDLSTYCKKDIHIWRATMMRNYFNSPWATISFVVGTIILLLSITSTTLNIIRTVLSL